MSWLILETARPRSARCFCSFSALNMGYLALGDAEFVLAIFRNENERGIVGRRCEIDHVAMHDAHWPQQHFMDDQVDQACRYHGNDEGYESDVARIDEHGVAKRRIGGDNFDDTVRRTGG